MRATSADSVAGPARRPKGRAPPTASGHVSDTGPNPVGYARPRPAPADEPAIRRTWRCGHRLPFFRREPGERAPYAPCRGQWPTDRSSPSAPGRDPERADAKRRATGAGRRALPSMVPPARTRAAEAHSASTSAPGSTGRLIGVPPVPARPRPTDDRRAASPGQGAAATGQPGLPRRCAASGSALPPRAVGRRGCHSTGPRRVRAADGSQEEVPRRAAGHRTGCADTTSPSWSAAGRTAHAPPAA